jgi:exopolysaccharide biosynthesis predicted pyruvyltransferase EpsI
MANIDVISDLRDQTEQVILPLADPSQGYALLDFPDYSNVGDSLIWLGELAFFDRVAKGKRPGYVCTTKGFNADRLRATAPEGPIYLSGGGNFGDLWPRFQEFREAVVTAFPDRKIIQLPQTLHFSSETILEQTQRFIGQHRDFTLLVRDQKSLAFAREKFDCPSHLSPDMAFNIGQLQRPASPGYDAVCLMRTDKETSSGRGDVAAASGLRIQVTDWIDNEKSSLLQRLLNKASGLVPGLGGEIDNDYDGFQARAEAQMLRGMGILGQGKTVITDRLHGHILSLLMRIPHVVLDNSYGKISGFMEQWTHADPIVQRASTFAEAQEKIERMLPASLETTPQ